MSEEYEEYTSEEDFPDTESNRDYRVWNVYWRSSTGVCSVAKSPPGAVHHRHGPDTWQGCWAYIGRACKPAGGVSTC